MPKRKALGKGLSALIPEADQVMGADQAFFQCPLEAIEPNPYQPRQDLHEEEMQELINSVKEKGVITPLLVSKTSNGYQLIAGERRWRAALKAGLERVPVVVRETSPVESLELALIENIHRKDLNPLEEALAYQRWLEDTGGTQESLAGKLGRERSTITNTLRLLSLPSSIQKDLMESRLSMGHARVLAGLKGSEEQKALRDLIFKKGFSVRQAEEWAKRKKGAARPRKKRGEDEHYFQSLADHLKRSLSTRVDIKRKGKGGSIIIHYYSDQDLDRLLDRLS
jgi:ParB family chromosome partitioning protein